MTDPIDRAAQINARLDCDTIALVTNAASGTEILSREGRALFPLVDARGWSPVLAAVTDDDRIVLKVADWIGGVGVKPDADVYIGAEGYVTDIAEAVQVDTLGALDDQFVLKTDISLFEASLVDTFLVEAVDDHYAPTAFSPDMKMLTGIDLDSGAFVAGISNETSPPDESGRLPFVDAGVLKFLDVDGAHTLSAVDDWTWLRCDRYNADSCLAYYQDVGGTVHCRMVSYLTGNLFPAGAIYAILVWGQSNNEGQGGYGQSLIRENYPSNLFMPDTPSENVWMGLTTSGGDSLPLDPDDITGFTALKGAAADVQHLNTNQEGLAFRLSERASAECGGWRPKMVIVNVAEGGQSAENMAKDAPAGCYMYGNAIAALTKLAALAQADGEVLKIFFEDCCQTENGTGDADKADKHWAITQDRVSDLGALLGQTSGWPLFDFQMSSFQTSTAVVALMTKHRQAVLSGIPYFCGGATYGFPFSTDDGSGTGYLHQNVLGHWRHGELESIYIQEWLNTGRPQLLELLSWAVTGTNEITLTMSEAVEIISDHPVVPAITNAGIVLTGATVSAVAVDGADKSKIIVTTSGGAASATAVKLGLNAQANPRTEENIPRTNIFSETVYGTSTYGDGEIRKVACHDNYPST